MTDGFNPFDDDENEPLPKGPESPQEDPPKPATTSGWAASDRYFVADALGMAYARDESIRRGETGERMNTRRERAVAYHRWHLDEFGHLRLPNGGRWWPGDPWPPPKNSALDEVLLRQRELQAMAAKAYPKGPAPKAPPPKTRKSPWD